MNKINTSKNKKSAIATIGMPAPQNTDNNTPTSSNVKANDSNAAAVAFKASRFCCRVRLPTTTVLLELEAGVGGGSCSMRWESFLSYSE